MTKPTFAAGPEAPPIAALPRVSTARTAVSLSRHEKRALLTGTRSGRESPPRLVGRMSAGLSFGPGVRGKSAVRDFSVARSR